MATGIAAPAAHLPGQPASNQAIARLGAVVDAWEHDLGSVVADETYRQDVVRLPRSGVTRESNRPPREGRVLVSELTLIHFDEPSEWIGFRSVSTVDDRRPPAPLPSLVELMNDPSLTWDERWRRVRDISAAFNIGSIARDVNLPTFALAALRTSSQRRFQYTMPRAESVGGERLRVIGFRERARPTLVAGLRGRDVALEGKVWFTDGEWRVRRTQIELRDRVVPLPEEATQVREEELTSRITVTFGPDENVGTWVPLEMRERYDHSWGETTTGHATYGNFRRFRTSGRLIRPR